MAVSLRLAGRRDQGASDRPYADSPGHPEPGTDEIHFVYCFWNLGQNGWIGCEYRPLARTEAWLGWLQLFNRRYAFCS